MKSDIKEAYFKYYDEIYRNKEYEKEFKFICSILEKYNSKPTRILEFGSGTCRFSILLANQFSDITCIDSSMDMINSAKLNLSKEPQYIRSRIKLINCDLRQINLKSKFDLLISLFHVASYCTTNNCLNSFFERAKEHLNKNSLFIFDYWYGPAVLHLKPSNRVKKINFNEFNLIRKCNSELDSLNSIVNVNYEVNLKSNKSDFHDVYFEKHSMRYLFLNEIDFFAEKHGFDVLKHSSWMNFCDPSLEDWNAFTILRKR